MNRSGPKLALIVLVAAVTATVSGYFMGLRQTVGHDAVPMYSPRPHTLDEPEDDTRAPIAPTYRTLATRQHQPNAGWRTRLNDLAPAPAAHESTHPLTDDERTALRALRASRRAYEGAPPVVPHAVDQRHGASCLACHGQPTVIGGLSVAQISHSPYQNCLQCHAAGAGPTPDWASPPRAASLTPSDNGFAGAMPRTAGSRAYEGAPPVIAHPVWMRENCMSCHGAGGSSAIKPDHGGRQSCLQCHATDSTLEQRPLVLGALPALAP